MEELQLSDLDPFDLLDVEADRLDRYFSQLDDDAWERPSRCEGWRVRDVLGHLAGEELYNHACLDDDLEVLWAMLERAGVKGLDGFNQWCVDERAERPVGEVLDEWRSRNGEFRRRMRERGRDDTLTTSVGPYPVGLQAFHIASELATHADDVGVPVGSEERAGRTAWRAAVGRFALGEEDKGVEVETRPDGIAVRSKGRGALLPEEEFVDATVARLPADHPLDPSLREALRALA